MYYGIEMLKKQGRMPFFWRKQSASGRGGCGGAKRRDHAAFSFGLWKKPCGQFLSIPLTAPHQSRLRQASFTFYGIAATGSYVPLDSLRDAPPPGYAYLREAVLLMVENPMQSITKELYPGVARQFGCTSSQVERSIRNAIQQAWEKRSDEVWSTVFQTDNTGTIPRPSNAAFVSRLADRLLLDQVQLAMP